MIEAHGLIKQYGSTTAVNDLSFTVGPGIVAKTFSWAERRREVRDNADDPGPQPAVRRHGNRQRQAVRAVASADA